MADPASALSTAPSGARSLVHTSTPSWLNIVVELAVEREGRFHLAVAQCVEDAPEARPHAVFVPGPVRNVGLQRASHRGRKHGSGHGAGRLPRLDVRQVPEYEGRAAGQLQGGRLMMDW